MTNRPLPLREEQDAEMAAYSNPYAGMTENELEAQFTKEDPRYPARKAASEALHAYITRWIDNYELDDGEHRPHAPSEFERFVIYDAFAGLTGDEEYQRLHDAWQALCGPATTPKQEAVTAAVVASIDRGPWVAQRWPDGRVVMQSDDFTHDVALIVNGDFENDEQRLQYATGLAAQFNAALPSTIPRVADHLEDGGKAACARCGGTGAVEDGELTHYEGTNIPYENGPIKCMKDCPVCKADPQRTAIGMRREGEIE